MDRVPPVRIPAAREWRRHNSMMSVLSGLLAVGLAVGLSAGSALAVEPTDNTGAGQSATQALDSLEVKGRAPKTGYKRTQFGKAWADVDRNGCETYGGEA